MAEDQKDSPAPAETPATVETAADPEKEALKAQVSELQAALKKSSADLKKAKDGWKSDVAELKGQLAAAKKAAVPAADACDGNHVSLDGAKYDIIWRSTVKDLAIEGYQKRHVSEAATAIVIVKEGG